MKITTLNIHKKLDSKIKYLKQLSSDIICLQETTSITEQSQTKLENYLNVKLYINNGDNKSKGTVIMVKNNIFDNIIQTNTLNINIFHGRLVCIKLTLNKDVFNIINIYAPNKYKESENFYKSLNLFIKDQFKPTDFNILLGDFNLVDHQLDVKSGVINYNKKSIKYLAQIKQFLDISDIYRELYKNSKIYTHTPSSKSGSRIDRIYITKIKLNRVNDIIHLPVQISDHKSVSVNINFNKLKWGPSFWKINNSILENTEYQTLIKEFWNKWQSKKLEFKEPLVWWDKGKKQIKYITIKYCKDIKNKRETEKQNLLADLKTLEQTEFKLEDKINIENKILDIENNINQGILVRSRLNYTTEDMDNIDFFKNHEVKNGEKRAIQTLIDAKDNTKINDKEEITNYITEFYSDLYTSQNINEQKINQYLNTTNLNQLNCDEQHQLEDFINEEECKKALEQFHNNKTPGIDGLSKEFYATFWDIMGADLTEIINNIYLTKKLPETMGNAIINLIYKNKGDHRELKNWRPISLLCVDYKIISKVITNRISIFINKLININQTGAGKDKTILNNLYNIQSILDYMNQKNINGAVFSFDQEKAFDRIEHNYIFKLLEKYNMPTFIIQWIKIFYKNITSQIQINGLLSPKIPITRSIRQGCPLSMILYALAIEPLSANINANENITGITIPNFPTKIKLFQHADDCSAITTCIQDFKYYVEDFIEFGTVSGSKLNENKTDILLINNKHKHHNFDKNLVKNNIKILGIWFGEHSIAKNWLPLIVTLTNTVKIWQKRKISFKSKIQVINTFLLSKIWYVARICYPNDKIIKDINKILFTYLWGNKMELIARQTLYLNYEDGGIKFPDFKTKINAMLLHRINSLLNNQTLPWASLAIYWIGLIIKSIKPDFAKNKYVHTVNIPNIYQKFKTTYHKINNKLDIDWHKVTLKQLNKILLYQNDYKPKIFSLHKQDDIQQCFINVQKSNYLNNFQKDTLYLYINKKIITKQLLYERNIYLDNYKCNFCKTTPENFNHLFFNCPMLHNFREYVNKYISHNTELKHFNYTKDNIYIQLSDNIIPYTLAYIETINKLKNFPDNTETSLICSFQNHIHKNM